MGSLFENLEIKRTTKIFKSNQFFFEFSNGEHIFINNLNQKSNDMGL